MSQDVSRRGFLHAASGASIAGAGGMAASGGATAQKQRPDFGGWLAEADGGFRDVRGQDEVTVDVGAEGNGGNVAFSPAGLWIGPDTTVVWEWTGDGGQHNVASVGDSDFEFRSGDPVESAEETFEQTFEEGGIAKYQCEPHASLEMKGAIAVGNDVPTAQPGNDGDGDGGGETPTAVGYDRPYSEVVIGGVASAFVGVVLVVTVYLTYLGYLEDRKASGDEE